MKDTEIIALYWKREEEAILRTQEKYGKYCYSISFHILHDREDADECVNDTYLSAWQAMPPHRPELLSAFLGKITRNLSIKKFRTYTAKKRGGGEAMLTFDELEECIGDSGRIDEALAVKELAAVLNDFLGTLSEDDRRIFLCRYFYFDSIAEISERFACKESRIKMRLKRTRDRLAVRLEKEGIVL